MPGGDGPKVVFCTTENSMDHISRALHAGANEYIMKPFDRDIVTAKFQEVGLVEEPDLNLICLPLRGSRGPARL
jgi:two-component system chemotaxis response regulator CheY